MHIIKKIINFCRQALAKLNLKIIASRALELCVLAALTAAAVAYAGHAFEIPFLSRGSDASGIEIDVPATDAGDAVPEAPAQELGATTLHVINPELVSAAPPLDEECEYDGAEPLFEHFADLASVGFARTGTVFGADARYEYAFAQVSMPREPPADRRALGVVMDYIIVRGGGRSVLHDASGQIIDADFGMSGLEILDLRDWHGRTIFRRREFIDEELASQTHYIFNAASRAFEPIFFIEEWGDRGAYFTEMPYFGASVGEWAVSRNAAGRWGWQSVIDPDRVIAPDFDRAFRFSEGVGAAYRTTWTARAQIGNRLYFHDADGYLLNREFFAPDPGDTETGRLGFFYFEYGLTRVINKRLNVAGSVVPEERQHLINRDFREFFTPADYNILAYSDGMILLEKNGRFGFMNHLGEWVAQPIYTYARPFSEGVAVLGMRGQGGWQMLIDRQGNIITPGRYSYISDSTGGIVALFDEGAGWTVLNKVRRRIA